MSKRCFRCQNPNRFLPIYFSLIKSTGSLKPTSTVTAHKCFYCCFFCYFMQFHGHDFSSVRYSLLELGWYAEFMLKIILQFLLGKTRARLNLKIMLNSLHIGPDAKTTCANFIAPFSIGISK